jgi:hypothetical protein
VIAQSNGSLNHLAASWQTISPNVDLYRYAIGTTPEARTLVGWTYLAATSIVHGDSQPGARPDLLCHRAGAQHQRALEFRQRERCCASGETPTAVDFRIFLPAINR